MQAAPAPKAPRQGIAQRFQAAFAKEQQIEKAIRSSAPVAFTASCLKTLDSALCKENPLRRYEIGVTAGLFIASMLKTKG